MASRMLVTHALPYANGSLHLGHMVESVQTDVFVRAMNAMGTECIFICADDTHGTPIEISARKAGVAPEEWIARIQREHAEDYKAFEIGFEELPATETGRVAGAVRDSLTGLLNGTRLRHGHLQVMSGPRRVVAVVAKERALRLHEEKRKGLGQHRQVPLRGEEPIEERRSGTLHARHEQRVVDHALLHPQM